MMEWKESKEGMTEELKESLHQLDSTTLILEMGEVARRHRVMVSLTVTPYDEEEEEDASEEPKTTSMGIREQGSDVGQRTPFQQQGEAS
jgi:hypothetical protein